MNILCKNEKKIKVRFFLFICVLKDTCFVCNSMGNGPVEGAVTSILKQWSIIQKHTFILFLILQKMSRFYPWT